jgi:AraC-like DNA-binding protein
MMKGMPDPIEGYREQAPPPSLRPYVSCTWIGAAPAHATSEEPPVLPDGCIGIVWDGSSLFVAGPDTAPAHVDRPPGVVFAGLRFNPGAAPAALGVPASALLDSRVGLRDIWGHQCEALEDGLCGLDPVAVPAALVAAVTARLHDEPAVDPLVRHAVQLVAGGATVRATAAAVDVSDRQLQRRFNAAVGYGAKTFARIARFRRFLQLAEHARPGTSPLAGLAAEAGYADQPHLTRECVALGGLPPLALLASRGVRFVQDGAPTPA